MITPTFIIGIILTIIGIMIVLYSIYQGISQKEPLWILGFGFSAFLLILPGALFIDNTPTKQDVLDNKAHYVKELNVYDNDTIVTYRIDFNKQTLCQ